MQLAAISDHSAQHSPELLCRETHNTQGRFCVLISDYFKCATFCTTVQSCKAAASNSCFDSCLCEVQSQAAEIPLVVGWEQGWVCCWCEFQQCRLTAWWGLFSALLESALASQVGAAAPSPALCCQQHLMSGTRLLFFFCKFIKSLVSLSHLLPQFELNLQLLIFLFISVV